VGAEPANRTRDLINKTTTLEGYSVYNERTLSVIFCQVNHLQNVVRKWKSDFLRRSVPDFILISSNKNVIYTNLKHNTSMTPVCRKVTCL
jgi:hypothetical protein